MKLILTIVLLTVILVSCGKRSDPEYQGKAKNQINIVL